MQIVIVLVLVLLAGAGAWYYSNNRSKSEAQEPDPIVAPAANGQEAAPAVDPAEAAAPEAEAVPPAVDPDQGASAAGEYENGTYQATGGYRSPAGEETVSVSVTLSGDVVTGATFTGNATNPSSIRNQTRFKEGFEAAVVGKKLDEISLTVVNGSSLTPIGFMDALEKVKAQAQA